jgi:hypothetical protein
MKTVNNWIAVFALMGLVMIPGLATADQIVMQTQATAFNAVAGEQNATLESSALISVLVTKEGFPVSSLGVDVGDGTSPIELPSKAHDGKSKQGWRLRTVVAPDGGCLMTPTQFDNKGGGVYVIRVVPDTVNKSCVWVEGDYHYVVDYGPVKGRRGSALGELTIPAAPIVPPVTP